MTNLGVLRGGQCNAAPARVEQYCPSCVGVRPCGAFCAQTCIAQAFALALLGCPPHCTWIIWMIAERRFAKPASPGSPMPPRGSLTLGCKHRPMGHRKNSPCGGESLLGGNSVVGGLEGEPADAPLTLTLRINKEKISTRFTISCPPILLGWKKARLAFLQ